MKSYEIIARTDTLFQDLKKYPENSPEYRDLEAEIVKINLRLVTHVAKGFFRLCGPTLGPDDLVSEGYVGLVKAVRTFDSAKAIAFSSYAVPCIKNQISTFLRREPTTKKTYSLEANVIESHHGDKLKLSGILASPVNMEEDFADQDETERQIAWIRKNLDQLKPIQKQVLISRYLSGDASLVGDALAKKFNCTTQNIYNAESRAIDKLRKIYAESHPKEIKTKKAGLALTNEEKRQLKAVLKNLVATELAPMQRKTMLCKFYSPTPKTNEQVAEEIGSTKQNVAFHVSVSYKKLCTLCDSIKDTKHLRNILEFSSAESGKEY